MNPYLQNLKKIEFVITHACTGRCKHCSEGEHTSCGEHINPQVATRAVREVAEQYAIQTVMTFGGEPLLYLDAVYAIHTVAKEMGIPRRQVITNGFFTKSDAKMREVATQLAVSGVNDLRLSVDAFHQESIPLDIVRQFGLYVKQAGIPIKTQPAWLVSREDDNPYNLQTRKILEEFETLGIQTGDGNIIFPEGNAKIYLAEYFTGDIPPNPYVEDFMNIRCLSFSPNGEVLGGNVYQQSIMEILNGYRP